MRKRIFEIIQIGSKEDLPSRLFDIFIVANIILNILAMFLETFDQLSRFHTLFGVIEAATAMFFCVEYVLRIWTADLLYPELSRAKAVLKFLRSFDGIVDLLTILPFYYLSGFIVFRMLRVVRIFHLFRLNAQYDSFNIIFSVIMEKRNQIMSSLFIIIVLMFASSLGIYACENEAQPDVFTNAFSGIWWSMATLLTVGYGDIYPVTVIGRIMAIMIAFLGVGVVAIPTGIVSAGFVEQYSRNQHSEKNFKDIGRIGEILVNDDSEFCGMSIGDIRGEYSMKVIVMMRDGLTVIASDDVTVKSGDILVTESDYISKA